MKFVGSLTLFVLLAFTQNTNAQILEVPPWLSPYLQLLSQLFHTGSSLFQNIFQNFMISATTPVPPDNMEPDRNAKFINESEKLEETITKLIKSANHNFSALMMLLKPKNPEAITLEEENLRVKRAPQKPNANPVSGMLNVLETLVTNASLIASNLRTTAESISGSATSPSNHNGYGNSDKKKERDFK